jgi:hypothetical protein
LGSFDVHCSFTFLGFTYRFGVRNIACFLKILAIVRFHRSHISSILHVTKFRGSYWSSSDRVGNGDIFMNGSFVSFVKLNTVGTGNKTSKDFDLDGVHFNWD